MTERYRNATTRNLVAAVRKAGGTVARAGVGKLVISGPGGTVTINEPSGETRRDLRRSSAGRLIEEKTGLSL
jgi:hypothetical protein